MVDTVSPEVRSRIMASVRSKDTKPEMKVRRLLHGLGYRYRLHRSDLPGRPDLVFPSRRKIVFVNGCFWHNHADCVRASVPTTNRDFWRAKLSRNRERDESNVALLKESGWAVTTVWECQLEDLTATTERLTAFLDLQQGDTSRVSTRTDSSWK